jgi:hypothetical protein
MERTVEAVPGEEAESAGEELGELGLIHLARGHCELAMVNRTVRLHTG